VRQITRQAFAVLRRDRTVPSCPHRHDSQGARHAVRDAPPAAPRLLAHADRGQGLRGLPHRAGHRVRYFTAPDLVETLYRGLADNSVGKTIDTLLRNDLVILDEVGFAPLDDTGTQFLSRLVAAAYERRALAIASHWSFEDWGRFLPEHTTAVSLLDRLLHHATTVATNGTQNCS